VDAAKAVANFAKHEVSFEDDGEQRWQAIGLANACLLLAVIHVIRERNGSESIRIVSARQAERKERRRYEESNG
jgi:uncharacterized protein